MGNVIGVVSVNKKGGMGDTTIGQMKNNGIFDI